MSKEYPDRNVWLAKRHQPNLAVTYRQRSTFLFVSVEVGEKKHTDENGVEHKQTFLFNQRVARSLKLDDAGKPIRLPNRHAFIDVSKSRRNIDEQQAA